VLPTSINSLSCDKSTLMLMQITIPALTWPTERYPTETLLISIKSFTYFFHSRFRASLKSNYFYTRVRPLFTSYATWPKVQFRYLGNGIQSAWIVSTFSLFSSTSLAVAISYFHPPRGSVKVGNFRSCFSLIREPEVT